MSGANARNWLKKIFGKTTKQLPLRNTTSKANRLGLETLESREVPATITSASNVLTYAAVAGVNNSLTVTISGSNFVFNDTGETITTSISGATGSGTNTVNIPTASVTGITLNLSDGADTIRSTAGVVVTTQNLTINHTGTGLTLAGPITTTSGAVSISSSNAITASANINSGTGTISISANQDGVGTEGFSQTAGTITTTNTTATAATIIANTTGGGTGNIILDSAAVGASTTGGTLTVNSRGGSIVYAGGTALSAGQIGTSNGGSAPTRTLIARAYTFTASGTGGIGTDARPIQSSVPNSGTNVSLSAGSGGIFWTDWTNPVNLTQAVADGGDIRVVTANSGGHNLTIAGQVHTGSGNIYLAADDNVTVNAVTIGGTRNSVPFAGTVWMSANRDRGTAGQTFTMNTGAAIVTTNTTNKSIGLTTLRTPTDQAVYLDIEGDAGAQSTITLGNITTGNGGRIVVNSSPRYLLTSGTEDAAGRIIMAAAANVLDAGGTGTVELIGRVTATTVADAIGTSALPVNVAGGNLVINNAYGNTFVTSTAAATITSLSNPVNAIVTGQTGSPTFSASTTAGAVTVAGVQSSISTAAWSTTPITVASSTATTATITTSVPHGLQVGQTVTISGMTPAGYNGSFVVASVTSSTVFTFATTANPGAGTVFGSVDGRATITTMADHGLSVGQRVNVSGISPSGYNGEVTVAQVTSPTSFTYYLATDPTAYVSGGSVTPILGNANGSAVSLNGPAGVVLSTQLGSASTGAINITGPLSGSGNIVTGTGALTVTQTTDSTYSGNITGTQNVVKAGAGNLALSGTGNTYTGSTAINAGNLILTGSQTGTSNVTTATGSSLFGTGTLSATQISGAVSPGTGSAATGILNASSLNFTSTATLTVDASGTTVGTQYDQVNVTGTVNLNSAVLNFVPSFNPTAGDKFIIVSNDDVDPVVGTFSGLGQDATVSVNGFTYAISYVGGDGNDVTLTNFVSTTRYVDDAWASNNPGDTIADADPVAGGNQQAIFGTTAFASLNAALAVAVPGDVIVVNQGTYAEAVVVNSAVSIVFQEGPSSILSLAGTSAGASITLNGVELTVGSDNADTSYSGAVNGNGTFTKVGTGTLTFNSGNGLSGALNLNGGKLVAGAAGAFGNAPTTTLAAGTELRMNGFSQALGSIDGAGTITNNSTTNVTLTTNTSSITIFTGILSQNNTGTISLVKNGTGTLQLNGASTYTGSTTVNDGTLRAGASTTVFGVNSAFTVGATATLALNGFNVAIGSLSGSGNVGNGNAANNSILTVGGDNSNTVFTGTIVNGGTGTLALVKTGTGQQDLNAANTFTGGTVISQGTLTSTNIAGGLGTGTVTLGDANTGSNNVAYFGGLTSQTTTIANNFVVSASGTGTATIGTNAVTSGNNTQWNGTLTLNRDVILRANSIDRTSFAGLITGTGNITIIAAAATNRVAFVQSSTTINNFVGNIDIQSGELQVGVASTTSNQYIPDSTSINVASGATLRFSSTSTAAFETFNALSGAGAVRQTEGTGAFTLTIGSSNGSGVFSGTLAGIASTGGFSLVKVGTGTQTFSGSSTTGWNTVVNGGTLLLNNTTGSALGTGTLTVGPLGTVGGTGSITGAVTSNGRLLPGVTTGILSTGNLAFGSGSNFIVDINSNTVGTGYDQANVTGTVNLTGSVIKINVGGTLTVGDKFTIINNDLADAVTGTFANGVTITALNDPRYVFTVDTAGDSGNDVVVTLALIETSTLLDVTGGVITFNSIAGTTNGLTVTNDGTNYTVTDAAGPITLSANAITAGWTLDGSGAASGPLASVTGLILNLGDGADQVSGIAAGAANVTINGSIALTVAGAVTTTGTLTINDFATIAVQGTVTATSETINTSGTITGTTAGKLIAPTLILNAAGGIGTSSNTLQTQATTVTATSAGVINLTEDDGATITASTNGQNPISLINLANSLTATTTTSNANITINNQGTGLTLTANAGGAGSLTATNAAGALTIAGASSTTIGNLTLSSSGSVAVNGALSTTSGNLVINSASGLTTSAALSTTAGALTLTNTAGTLATGSTLATVGASLSLSSGDAISLGGNVSVGNGTITIAANTDGAGAQGYDQKAATLTSTNATVNALSITVNTAGGGTGDAIIGQGDIGTAAGGTATIKTFAGSTLWSNDAVYTAFTTSQTGLSNGGNNSQTLRAAIFSFLSSSNGGVGTNARPVQLDSPGPNGVAAVPTLTASVGAGGIYVTHWDRSSVNDLTLGDITATGAGNIRIVAANQGGHNLYVKGNVSTGSGNIYLAADDNLEVQPNVVIGGAGFSGTVWMTANRDVATNGQPVTFDSTASIVTSSTVNQSVAITARTPLTQAVYLEIGGGGTGGAGIVQVGNITTGNGGRVVLNGSNVASPTQTGLVRMASTSNIIDVGSTGTLELQVIGVTALSDNVGSAATPIRVAGGNVVVNVTNGNVYVTGDSATNFTAATTTSGSLNLTTTAGQLTINGTTATAGSGAINLTAKAFDGGVNINAPFNNSTTGTITIDAGGNTATLNSTFSPNVSQTVNITSSTGLVVSSTGTLGGTGAASNNFPVVAQTTSTVSPAGTGTVGNLSIGNLSAGSGSNLRFDVSATPTNDTINVTGTVDVTSASPLINVIGFPTLNTAYTLINNDGTSDAVTGQFLGGTTVVAANDPRYSFTVNYAGGDGNDVLATLTAINANALIDVNPSQITYAAAQAVNNNLTVTQSGSVITITDTTGNLTLSTRAVTAGWTLSAGNTVASGNAGTATLLSLLLGDGSDTVTSIDGQGLAINLEDTGTLNVTGTVSSTGAITFTGMTDLTVGASGKFQAATLTLTATNALGTSSQPLATTATNVVASAGAGGIYITEADGANFTVNAKDAGNISIVNTTGTLNIAGSSSTVTGNVSLSSGDAVTLTSNLNAGSGTITIAANTDGTGAQGYDQFGASITTTNTTANALSITVNTATGTGNAVLGQGSIGSITGGTVTVNSNGGSILWSNDAIYSAFGASQTGIGNGGSNTQTLQARVYTLTATGAVSSIGTDARPLQLENYGPDGQAVTPSLTAAAGDGGVYATVWDRGSAYDLTIGNITATGPGGIRIVAANATGHNLFVVGNVSTGSGNIFLAADDNITVGPGATIGGAGFSGTVWMAANRDLASNGQSFTMNATSAIVTSSTVNQTVAAITSRTPASQAVYLDISGDSGTSRANITVGNITTGNGGRVVIYPSGDSSDGRVTMASSTNLIDVGSTGVVQIETLAPGSTLADSIGTAALPIRVAGGTVTTSSVNGHQYFSSTNALSVGTTAVTTAGNLSYITASGGLTVNSTVASPNGTVTLNGADGVVLNANVGSATTGAIGITGGLSGSSNILTGTGALTVTQATDSSYAGVISGNQNVVKAGPGNLTLTGTSTFTGSTTLNAGSLTVNGKLQGTSGLTTVNGTVLSGNGTISGSVNATGASLTPGTNSTAILNTGALTLGTGTIYTVNLTGATTAGTDYDQLNVTGAVTVGGSLNILVGASPSLTVGDTFTIVNNDAADTVSGTFSNSIFVASDNPRYLFTANYAGGDGNDVVLTLSEILPLRYLTVVNSNSISYSTANGIDSGLTLAFDGINSSYTLTDSSGVIGLSSAAITAGWTGDGTNTVTGPSAGINTVSFSLADGNDGIAAADAGAAAFTIFSNGTLTSAGAITTSADLNFTNHATLTLNGAVTAVNFLTTGIGTFALNALVTASTTVSINAATVTNTASGQIVSPTVTLSASNGIGASGARLLTNANTITATTGAGGIYLGEANGATITATSTGAGVIDVANTTGDLTISATSASGNITFTNNGGSTTVDGATSSTSGNISISSSDAVTLGANLNAGSGTITIAANTDGAGAQGYDQLAAILTTTNTSTNALSITVNTSGGGTGDAVIGRGTIGGNAGGTAKVVSNAGNILWSATTTASLAARDYIFTATGAASIGTSTRPIATDNFASIDEVSGGGTANLAAGTGGIYLNDSGGLDLTINSAISQGAGNIAINSLGAGGHNLFINGVVTTGTGSITMTADDELTLTATGTIGGAGFSGTVSLLANSDAGNNQTLNMMAGSSIVTSNNTATAVSLGSQSANGSVPINLDLPAGGVTLSNITTGSGGTVTVNAAVGSAASRQGSIIQHPGTLINVGNGTVSLTAFQTATTGANNAGNIGVAGSTTSQTLWPIRVTAGNVIATTNGTTLGNTGSIAIISTGTTSYTASTTGNATGTISLTSEAGIVTIGGATNTDGGSITLTSTSATGGVLIASTLNDSNTGSITISAGTNTATLTKTLTLNDNQALSVTANGGLTLSGGVLAGTGATGNTYQVTAPTTATVSPGSAGAGILSIGNFNLAGGALVVDLNGTTAGTGYDQVKVAGTVNLTAASLNTSFGFSSNIGDTFTIVDNDGTDAVTGTFNGLAQGAQFKSGAALFQISYTGGTGNDVTVTRINAPVPTAPTVLMNGTTAPASTLNLSRITSLVLTFNTFVTVETGAFSITNGTFTLTDAANAGILVSGSGSTTITLTFDPAVAGVEFGSLADGIWSLSTNLGFVKNVETVAGTGTVDRTDIRRLFGDINGDNSVDGSDFAEFGNNWGLSFGDVGFNTGFDFNSDGTIDGSDFAEFGNRWGVQL